jgi:hypothetical protein
MARVAQDRLARHALAELPDVAAIKKKSGAKDATRRDRLSWSAFPVVRKAPPPR